VLGKEDNAYGQFAGNIAKIKEFAEIGRFDLLGGEPFMNPGLPDFVQGLRGDNPDDVVHIVSNGFWMKSWEKYREVIESVNQLDITRHPEAILSGDEMKALALEISESTGTKVSFIIPRVFYKPTFTKEPIRRRSCKFCPQLLPDGRITKCHIIAFNDRYDDSPSVEFLERQSQGVFDLSSDDPDSFARWYRGRGDGLHECCDYCRFMEDKTQAVKHLEV
jgi:MoaA/NifB/PqqE/SkfB family radical SAM enzyme